MSTRLLQIWSLTLVNLRSLAERPGSMIACLVGIAGVVLVLVGVLSIAAGFRAAMAGTGDEDLFIVLRDGADSELTSGLSGEEARLVGEAEGLARAGDEALASAELFVMINLLKRSTKTDANVPMRGVLPVAFEVHHDLKITQGRRFTPGLNEVIVGRGALAAFDGLELGKTFRVSRNDWTVVGIFASGSGAADSEIWTDAKQLQTLYQRGDSYQSVKVRLAGPDRFDAFIASLKDKPIKFEARSQAQFLAEQSSALTGFIEGLGVGIAALMALGAMFGALNTMYSAVAARTREIATLRALGFGALPVVTSVLAESLFVALVGGAGGALIAYLVFNGYQASTMNWQSFTQVAFAFAVTPRLLVTAMLWAVVIGLLGGLFPAIRAARMPVAAALREN